MGQWGIQALKGSLRLGRAGSHPIFLFSGARCWVLTFKKRQSEAKPKKTPKKRNRGNCVRFWCCSASFCWFDNFERVLRVSFFPQSSTSMQPCHPTLLPWTPFPPRHQSSPLFWVQTVLSRFFILQEFFTVEKMELFSRKRGEWEKNHLLFSFRTFALQGGRTSATYEFFWTSEHRNRAIGRFVVESFHPDCGNPGFRQLMMSLCEGFDEHNLWMNSRIAQIKCTSVLTRVFLPWGLLIPLLIFFCPEQPPHIPTCVDHPWPLLAANSNITNIINQSCWILLQEILVICDSL